VSYRFVFTAWFDRNLKSLGRHNPNLRGDFESFLQTFDAQAYPVIPGTGGARKRDYLPRAKASGEAIVWYIICSIGIMSG